MGNNSGFHMSEKLFCGPVRKGSAVPGFADRSTFGLAPATVLQSRAHELPGKPRQDEIVGLAGGWVHTH